MYTSVLSVLLMGMLPVLGGSAQEHIGLADLSIAPPSPSITSLGDALSGAYPLSASGVAIVDLLTGQTVYSHNAEHRLSMASLAKLMTALLIVENHSMDELVKVPNDVGSVEGHVVHLPRGNHFTVGDLLKALLVDSANDAAVTLAAYHSGNIGTFVSEMNERAKALGLRNTSFANPIGLDDADQWSTPQDIAWLTAFDYRIPELRARLSLPGATIVSQEGKRLTLIQTHELLNGDSAVIAGKTGTTDAAEQCLMSVVKEGNREYIVVLLRWRDRYADMRAVLSALASLFS